MKDVGETAFHPIRFVSPRRVREAMSRASGGTISHPVWFVQEGEKLYLLPERGSGSDWYKNVLKNPAITLAANGVRWTATATPITDTTKVRGMVE